MNNHYFLFVYWTIVKLTFLTLLFEFKMTLYIVIMTANKYKGRSGRLSV